jgi:serine/threonine protein kinase
VTEQTANDTITPPRKPLSRQRSLSELVSRVKSSFKPSTLAVKIQPPTTYSSDANDYEMIRTLGAGASASVYSARYKPNHSLVAVKIVNLEEGEFDDSRLDALYKEIQIMTLSRHTHLLEVYQSFVASSKLHIITPIMSAGKRVFFLLFIYLLSSPFFYYRLIKRKLIYILTPVHLLTQTK